jgi:phosphoglycerate dehydrogenase-like enzyme
MGEYTILVVGHLPQRLSERIRVRLDPERYDWVVVEEPRCQGDLTLVDKAAFLIVHEANVEADSIETAEQLRLIVNYRPGVGRVAKDAADRRDIPVVEVPSVALQSVAEFTVLSVLSLAKEYVRAVNKAQEGVRPPGLQPSLTTQSDYAYNWVSLETFDAVYGKTVGVVGLGTVGKSVATLLRPFGVKVLYMDIRRLSESEERELGVRFVPLEDLLQWSDFVTLHLRFNESTEHLIGRGEFELMKPSAFIVNTSRGRVIDEDALCDALANGLLAGAALDVFEMEPLPNDSPLWEMDNVIITPHVAGIPIDRAAEFEADLIANSLLEYSD